MIHVPVSDNRVAQFAALFEPHNDGYVYYGDNQLGGLPLSVQERDHYVTHFANVLRTGNRLMIGWILCVAIGVVVAEEGYGWRTQDWQHYLVFLLPMPWVLWTWRHSRKIVLDEIGRRVPVTPPRTTEAGILSRVSAFPLGFPLTMIGIGGALLVQQWRYGLAFREPGGDLIGIGTIALAIWILWVKRRRR